MTISDQSTTRDPRLENWCQTPETRIADADAAARLIDRVGLATWISWSLFPVVLRLQGEFQTPAEL